MSLAEHPLAPPRRTADLVFFDGQCGFCLRWVRWLIRLDRPGRLLFAPLGGDTFGREIPSRLARRLPGSVVVKTRDGRILTQSDAALHIAERLSVPFRLLAQSLALIPARLRDALYETVARNRHRLSLGATGDACMIPSRDDRPRFLP